MSVRLSSNYLNDSSWFRGEKVEILPRFNEAGLLKGLELEGGRKMQNVCFKWLRVRGEKSYLLKEQNS
jgi:hypothetical protein